MFIPRHLTTHAFSCKCRHMNLLCVKRDCGGCHALPCTNQFPHTLLSLGFPGYTVCFQCCLFAQAHNEVAESQPGDWLPCGGGGFPQSFQADAGVLFHVRLHLFLFIIHSSSSSLLWFYSLVPALTTRLCKHALSQDRY